MNMLIGSLDIGIRNLGFCIYNTETNSIQHVEVIDLLRVRGSKRRLPFGDLSVLFLVKRMVADRAALFQQCTYIGIEKQMSRKMILIQFCLEAVLDQCCEVFQISPRCVKSMFGTSRGKHAANKRAAIVKMYELIDADARRIINESFPKKKMMLPMLFYKHFM